MNCDAQRTCDDAIAQALQSGVVAGGEVIFGAVAPASRRFAEERTGGAVVIGTHARTGLKRAFIGSTAERLMQTCTVPVVVTHADDVPNDGPIAIAVDGTRAANAAFRVAIDLARSRCRRLVIINVVRGGRESWHASRPILNETADLARNASLDFELVALEGVASEQIIATALNQKSAMIVISTSGRSDLARVIMGSVAAGVVENAHIPVTVVRET